MNVGEICRREVVVMDRKESAAVAVKLMREYHVGNVVVTQSHDGNQQPVGIITDRDIVIEVMAKDIAPDRLLAEDIMNGDLLTLNAQESEHQAIQRMRARGVRRAPVVNNQGYLEGIISIDDLLEVMAENLAAIAALFSKEQAQERNSRAT